MKESFILSPRYQAIKFIRWQIYLRGKARYYCRRYPNVFGGVIGLAYLRASQIIKRLNFTLNGGIDVSPIAEIGKGLFITNPSGIVIGGNSRIGDNAVIHQLVVIGEKNGGFPTIGKNVHIYSGAHIIGGIKVGDNAIIGAMSVVLKDVAAGSVVAGNPARVINT